MYYAVVDKQRDKVSASYPPQNSLYRGIIYSDKEWAQDISKASGLPVFEVSPFNGSLRSRGTVYRQGKTHKSWLGMFYLKEETSSTEETQKEAAITPLSDRSKNQAVKFSEADKEAARRAQEYDRIDWSKYHGY